MTDLDYMAMAIELAANGGKAVRPNPLVGAVIINDGKVVGKGYHSRYGAAHAEREAIADAGELARGGTIYVTLEPCNHHGKTPPCTEALIEAGVRRVAIGMLDPNPDVAGNGMQFLMDRGIECVTGIMEDRCKVQNEIYLVNVLEKRPFIQLKVAQTLDGFIAPEDGNSKWITGEHARTQAHYLRSLADSVMVGAGTLRLDNPALTVRHVDGEQPKRVLLTDSLDLPLDATMFSDAYRDGTLIIATDQAMQDTVAVNALLNSGIQVEGVHSDSYGRADMNDVLRVLWSQGVYSLLVEGGAGLYSSFLEANVADRLDVFIAPTIFGSGISVFHYIQSRTVQSRLDFTLSEVSAIGNDIYAVLRRG